MSHKWRRIANHLQLQLELDCHECHIHLTEVLERMFDNASQCEHISQGVVKLLEDAELCEVAEIIKSILFTMATPTFFGFIVTY